MKIGIAGAGLLGRLLALNLGRKGHEVHVYDPASGPQGRGAAGWTAAGMLSPTAELESADEHIFRQGLRSLTLWSEIIPGLNQHVSLSHAGSLLLSFQQDIGTAMRLVGLLEQKAPEGHKPHSLTLQELKALEPDIHGPGKAWLLPHEGHLNTVEAMAALQSSATHTEWHWNSRVSQVAPGQLLFEDHTLSFDHVFDARGTGMQTPGMSFNAHDIDCCNVRGVRGEIFWVQAPGVRLERPVRLLHPRHRVYVVPRSNHTFVIGASELESEDRSPVSLRSTVELLIAAHSILPGLAEARLIHQETNLRPSLADNLPRIEHQPGMTRINGLFRHGWLIAPAVVEEALHQFDPSVFFMPDITS